MMFPFWELIVYLPGESNCQEHIKEFLEQV
jgi:hypothetical protein